MSEDQYFVYREDRQLGPYTRAELRERLRRGEIEDADRCSPEDAEVFYRVGDVLAFDRQPEHAADDDGTARPLPAASVPMMGDTDPGRARADEGEAAPPPEEVVWRGHPTLISYWKSVIFGTLCGVAGVLVGPLWPPAPIVGIGLGFLILTFAAVDRTFRLYLVTRRRAEILTGIIARSSREVRIEDIRAINVDKAGLLGLLGVGSLEFDSAAGGETAEVRFENVLAAQRLKKLVRKLQDTT